MTRSQDWTLDQEPLRSEPVHQHLPELLNRRHELKALKIGSTSQFCDVLREALERQLVIPTRVLRGAV